MFSKWHITQHGHLILTVQRGVFRKQGEEVWLAVVIWRVTFDKISSFCSGEPWSQCKKKNCILSKKPMTSSTESISCLESLTVRVHVTDVDFIQLGNIPLKHGRQTQTSNRPQFKTWAKLQATTFPTDKTVKRFVMDQQRLNKQRLNKQAKNDHAALKIPEEPLGICSIRLYCLYRKGCSDEKWLQAERKEKEKTLRVTCWPPGSQLDSKTPTLIHWLPTTSQKSFKVTHKV